MEKIDPRIIKAAKDLVDEYDNVTINRINHIQNSYNYRFMSNVLQKITNFDSGSCILCRTGYKISGDGYSDYNARVGKCSACIHGIHVKAINRIHKLPCKRFKTYSNIKNAKNPQELLKAVKARSRYIKRLILKYTGESYKL